MKLFFSATKILKFFLGLLLAGFLVFQPIEIGAMQDLQPLFEQALRASKEGDLEEALERWNHLLELFPEEGIAFSNRGNVRLALGDPEGAIEDQTKAIDFLPLEADPYLNRGIAEETLHRWDQAKQDYRWILEKDPNNSSALYNLGNVYGSQDDWDTAEVLFSKASNARPGFVMARSSSALANYELGELEKAKSEFRSLIRKYPMLADARAGLSALLWREGFFGEAESNWTAAAGLDGRYRDKDWLLNSRRWPEQPTKDLMSFLALERR